MQRITPSRLGILNKFLWPLLILISVIFLVQLESRPSQAYLDIGAKPQDQTQSAYSTPPPALTPKPNPSIDIINLAAQPQPIPILMYHKTPADLAVQLDALVSKQYTSVSMSQLADYFDGLAILPAKPVVITFDDGYADQMQAYEMLRARNMKATFYLITGGAGSQYCIGITRTNTACGDDYLNIEQARMLAQSGLVEIGAHTTNHADLTSLSPDEQNSEMLENKKYLEKELNITITSLAYPYGKFDGTTVGLTQQAGFKTAVTTISGEMQSSNNRFTLLRVRDATLLP